MQIILPLQKRDTYLDKQVEYKTAIQRYERTEPKYCNKVL